MIDISRRRLLIGTTSLVAAPSILRAQDAFPSRPIKFIVPFPPGGSAEQQARLPALLMPETEQVCEQRRLAGLALGSRHGRFCGAIC